MKKKRKKKKKKEKNEKKEEKEEVDSHPFDKTASLPPDSTPSSSSLSLSNQSIHKETEEEAEATWTKEPD
jgi:hypothetical protein